MGQVSGQTTSDTCLTMAHAGVAQGTLPVCSSHFPVFSYVFPPELFSAV